MVPEIPTIYPTDRFSLGHAATVRSVAFSHDGSYALSGSDDNTLKLWDLRSSECIALLKGHTDKVRSVVFSLDGLQALSGSDDNTLKLWDLDSKKCIATLKGHTDTVYNVALSPDGARALSGSRDNTLSLWDLRSKRCIFTLEEHTNIVRSVAFSPNGLQALSGSYDSTLKLWDLQSNECITTLEGHAFGVYSVAFSPNGTHALSGSGDGTLRLWDLQTNDCITTLEGHISSVWSVTFSPNGFHALSGSSDGILRLWDLETKQCIATLEGEDSTVWSVAFNRNNLVGYSGTGKGFISIWNLALDKKTLQQSRAAQRKYTNAKVVLAGRSGVGKSGLAHRLIEDRFVQTPSTHGMQVWPLDIPLPEQEQDGFVVEREVLLWDMAGQADYRLIHQLFFDETALALILIDPQSEDPFSEALEWIKALDAAVHSKRKSSVAKLLIGARVDVGDVRVSQAKIDEFIKKHGLLGYLATSADSGLNCSDEAEGGVSALKNLISTHIPWDDLTPTITPRLFSDIKKELLDMKKEGTTSLIQFSVLHLLLQAKLTQYEHIKIEVVRTAASLLGNEGLVMPLAFGDLLLLKPELLNSYASAVIRKARTHIDEIGCVPEEDIFAEGFDWHGVERLSKENEPLMLTAMVETMLDRSLCISEYVDGKKQLIFPSQYRRDKVFDRQPNILVSYSFSGELQSIYTKLVVRVWYGNEFQNRDLWKNAAEFTTTEDHVFGFFMENHGEGRGTIRVFFDTAINENVKLIMVRYVEEHLEKTAREVKRLRQYYCPKCHRPFKDDELIREILDEGGEFVFCPRDMSPIKLHDHVERLAKSTKIKQGAQEMDRVAEAKINTQAQEQRLIGDMMVICSEAEQIFRPTTMFDHGIDGEIEFNTYDGKASGKRVYVQLKSGASFLRHRKRDDQLVFDIQKPRHIEHWQEQPVDVYLVIRDGDGLIQWMNITEYLQERSDKESRQVRFEGEVLNADAVLALRDRMLRVKAE